VSLDVKAKKCNVQFATEKAMKEQKARRDIISFFSLRAKMYVGAQRHDPTALSPGLELQF